MKRPLHDPYTNSTIVSRTITLRYITFVILQLNRPCDRRVKQTITSFILFVSMQYCLILRVFTAETDIRNKSYEKCRGKFRTRFPGVSVPSKPSTSESWRNSFETHTQTFFIHIIYIVCRSVSPLSLPYLWVRFSTEFPAHIPSTPKDLDLLFMHQETHK
jgi:hypothetical protein